MSKVKVKGQIMYFLVNAYPPKPLDVATPNLADILVTRCRGYWATFHVTLTQSRGQGQIMHFLVNASPPKPLDVAISNFAAV